MRSIAWSPDEIGGAVIRRVLVVIGEAGLELEIGDILSEVVPPPVGAGYSTARPRGRRPGRNSC